MRVSLVFAALLLSAVAGSAQPRLRTENPVVNGASYSPLIAPGSIFVVFGTNLAGEIIVQATSLPLGTSLGGVSIRFTPVSGGAAIDALMVYTTRDQIAGLLPSSAAPGDYNVTVTYNNQTSAPGRARVAARSIGIVSADASGSGQAQAQIYYTATQWSLTRFTSGQLAQYSTAVAHPGETLVLWGTGLGADAASDLNGGTSGDRTGAARVRIRIGDQEYTPAYSGRASGLPGTDQFNFILDNNVPTGCFVPVQIVADGTASNIVTLAIAPRGRDSCTHPFLSAAQLRRLSEGGTVTLGNFVLGRAVVAMSIPGLGSFETTTESVYGDFARYTAGNLGAFSEFGGDLAAQVGKCVVARFRGAEEPEMFVSPVRFLDAGNPLRLNGPNASNLAVERDANNNTYTLMLYSSGILGVPGSSTGRPTLAVGEYTLAGPGGRDVGAFTARVRVPAPFTWTNRDGIATINRSQAVSVTWTPTEGLMSIFGTSMNRVGGTPDDPIFDGGMFACVQNGAAGGFSVPASVLSQLPVSGDLATGTGSGFLGLNLSGPADGGPFTAPLAAGGSIDRGHFEFSYSSMKTVDYR